MESDSTLHVQDDQDFTLGEFPPVAHYRNVGSGLGTEKSCASPPSDHDPSLRKSQHLSPEELNRQLRHVFRRSHSFNENDLKGEEGKRWTSGDRHFHYQLPNFGDPSQACHEATQRIDKGMCDAWRDEIDKLLVLAGLFSAVVTAFSIESYKWLQPNPQDMSEQLLAQMSQMSAHLNNLVNQSNAKYPPILTVPIPRTISASVIRINCLWFLSLSLALSTALIGILCIQWMREYQRDAHLGNMDSFSLRQMRYEGLEAWYIPTIMAALPLFLQLGLLLFLMGLLDFLWSLNCIVATILTVLVGSVLLLVFATTIIPGWQFIFRRTLLVPQCPYKSPQSWAFYKLLALLMRGLTFVIDKTVRLNRVVLSGFVGRLIRKFRRVPGDRAVKSLHIYDWTAYDLRWLRERDAYVSSGYAEEVETDSLNGLQELWRNLPFGPRAAQVKFSILQSLLHRMRTAPIWKRVSTLSKLEEPGLRKSSFLCLILELQKHPYAERHPHFSGRVPNFNLTPIAEDVMLIASLQYTPRLDEPNVALVCRNLAIEARIRILNALDDRYICGDPLSLTSCFGSIISAFRPEEQFEVSDEILTQLLHLCSAKKFFRLKSAEWFGADDTHCVSTYSSLHLLTNAVYHLASRPLSNPGSHAALFAVCEQLEQWMGKLAFRDSQDLEELLDFAGGIIWAFAGVSPHAIKNWKTCDGFDTVHSLMRTISDLLELAMSGEHIHLPSTLELLHLRPDVESSVGLSQDPRKVLSGVQSLITTKFELDKSGYKRINPLQAEEEVSVAS